METVPMPVTIPSDVTLYDGNTITAADWRRLVEPVTGFEEIASSDLKGRRVRSIKHTGATKWVVTVDTCKNSWAYVIEPDNADDYCGDTHPVSVYWAHVAAATGLDARISPVPPHRHFDLPGSATGIIAKTDVDMWVFVLWHGYPTIDLRARGKDKNHYVTSAASDSATTAMNRIYHWITDNENTIARSGIDREAWLRMWSDFENVALLS